MGGRGKREQLLLQASTGASGFPRPAIGPIIFVRDQELVARTSEEVTQLPQRYFDLQQAQDNVPWLKETFQAAASLRETFRRLEGEIADLRTRLGSNGGSDLGRQLDARRKTLGETVERIRERLKPIEERGILVKDADPGLVDFPSLKEGREVYLCWREGEDAIRFWHEVDAGFAGRQPL